MKYTWIMFDADGTLFDYDQAEANALRETFEQAGLPFQPQYADAYRDINATIWLDFEQGRISAQALRVERFCRLFNSLDIDTNLAQFSSSYLRNLAHGTALIDCAEQTVKTLYARFRLLIITNGLKDVQRPRLQRSALNGYFADIVISDEIGFAKPDSRIFDVAFKRMGHPRKSEVLIVGDSLSADMRGGSDYGIDTCWFNPEGTPRQDSITIRYEISALHQLVDILGVG